jgi:hypothetical protein
MSYKNGMAAINLEMTDKVPRTEYSAAEFHFDLVNAVLGTKITPDSSFEERERAASAFRRAWDYGLNWSVDIFAGEFGDIRTKMGHAAFAAACPVKIAGGITRITSHPYPSAEAQRPAVSMLG